MGQDLGGGQEKGAVDISRPTLGAGVKSSHGINLVIKELAPHRLFHQG